LSTTVEPPQGNQSRSEQLAALMRAYATALLAGDEVAADVAIREAIDAGLSTADVNEGIIAPALRLVGELWQRGEITVADEHLATQITLRVLALQRETRRAQRSRRGHRVLLATPAGEQHVMALTMVGNLLSEAGYEVVMLGPDVPEDALAAAATRHRPAVIGLSVTMAGGADRALLAIYEVQERRPETGFIVGGRAVTSRLPVRPGIEVCSSAAGSVPAVDAIVNRAGLN
jgi:methanogenic corrinoid protein MtbC1